jgi:hypothetical protein
MESLLSRKDKSLNLIGIKSGQAVGVSIYEMFEDNEDVLTAIQNCLKWRNKNPPNQVRAIFI